MVEKKSLVLAMEEAQQLSLKNPGVRYYVMDKPGRRAACHGSEWCVKEKILAGWYIYCEFFNGSIRG